MGKRKLRKDRKLCRGCGKRPALFLSPSRGMITRDDGHDLCAQCERAKVNRERGTAKTLEAGAG